jgi:hypothetical protein
MFYVAQKHIKFLRKERRCVLCARLLYYQDDGVIGPPYMGTPPVMCECPENAGTDWLAGSHKVPVGLMAIADERSI